MRLESKFSSDFHIIKRNILNKIALNGEYRKIDKAVRKNLGSQLKEFKKISNLRKLKSKRLKSRKRNLVSVDVKQSDENNQYKNFIAEKIIFSSNNEYSIGNQI